MTVLFKTDSVNPGQATASIRFNQAGFQNNADTVHLTATTSLPTGIDTPKNEELLIIYPNPTQGELFFTPMLNNPYSLTIIGSNGSVIMQIPEASIEGRVVNFENYPSGEYFLRLDYESGSTEVKKIVKMR